MTKITIKISSDNKKICKWYAQCNDLTLSEVVDQSMRDFIVKNNLEEKFKRKSDDLLL